MRAAVRKFTPEIDATLYDELEQAAKANGQTKRFILERALEFYLHQIVPSQRTVRPDVMAAYRRSTEQYDDLYRNLANR